MKTKLVLIACLLTWNAHALEFVTLTENTPTRTVAATDLVEIVGTNKNNYGTSDDLVLTFQDGSSTALLLRGKENGQAFEDMKGNVFTGVTSISLQLDGSTGILNKPCVTLKITPADEIGKTPAGTVLVFPENTDGDYNVIVESSDDLVNWSLFSSQLVDAAASKTFYRTRIIKVNP